MSGILHKKSLWCIAGILLLTACGGSPKPTKKGAAEDKFINEPLPNSAKGLSSIVIADDLPASLKQYLVQDFKLIANFDASISSRDDSEAKRVLGIQALDAASLSEWLSLRLNYIISDQDSVYKMTLVYPNDRVYGFFNIQDVPQESAVAATNRGTAYYLIAKENAQRSGFQQYLRILINQKWVNLTRPRVGLMQIGPAFTKFQINPSNPAAYSNSALRIETLFHEARHSDGNLMLNNLGFTHVVCSAGSGAPEELIGKPACDDSSNGAYSVGAVVGKALWKKCGAACSVAERLSLEAIYLDNLSRVLMVNGAAAPAKDSTPEQGIQVVDIANFKLTTIQVDP